MRDETQLSAGIPLRFIPAYAPELHPSLPVLTWERLTRIAPAPRSYLQLTDEAVGRARPNRYHEERDGRDQPSRKGQVIIPENLRAAKPLVSLRDRAWLPRYRSTQCDILHDFYIPA